MWHRVQYTVVAYDNQNKVHQTGSGLGDDQAYMNVVKNLIRVGSPAGTNTKWTGFIVTITNDHGTGLMSLDSDGLLSQLNGRWIQPL